MDTHIWSVYPFVAQLTSSPPPHGTLRPEVYRPVPEVFPIGATSAQTCANVSSIHLVPLRYTSGLRALARRGDASSGERRNAERGGPSRPPPQLTHIGTGSGLRSLVKRRERAGVASDATGWTVDRAAAARRVRAAMGRFLFMAGGRRDPIRIVRVREWRASNRNGNGGMAWTQARVLR